MARLLLLEDDQSLIDGLVYALTKEGFALDVAMTVREARAQLATQAYDLLLLDQTLPDGSGLALCEEVRAGGNAVPIIFLTAMDEEIQVIRALDAGGDDYITKPFKLGELCSRIRAQLRRSGMLRQQEQEPVTEGTVRIEGGRAYREEEPLELTATELRLLACFLRNRGQVLTREQLLAALWDEDANFVDDNTLSVYIRRLREKVERDPSSPQHLRTVRGLGYEWREDV
ncbi:MAG: response regulator transcription factor [Peptococcaceae bacterium]|nr:response regulator transcription factor [Peptococcaceae bacterium]